MKYLSIIITCLLLASCSNLQSANKVPAGKYDYQEDVLLMNKEQPPAYISGEQTPLTKNVTNANKKEEQLKN